MYGVQVRTAEGPWFELAVVESITSALSHHRERAEHGAKRSARVWALTTKRFSNEPSPDRSAVASRPALCRWERALGNSAFRARVPRWVVRVRSLREQARYRV